MVRNEEDAVVVSKVLFRLTFILFVAIYLTVLAEFVNVQYYQFDFNIKFEAIFLTLIVGTYFYFYLRKSKF